MTCGGGMVDVCLVVVVVSVGAGVGKWMGTFGVRASGKACLTYQLKMSV